MGRASKEEGRGNLFAILAHATRDRRPFYTLIPQFRDPGLCGPCDMLHPTAWLRRKPQAQGGEDP